MKSLWKAAAAVFLTGCAASGNVISAEEAKTIMEQNPEALILDVRTEEEYEEGHIPSAVLLPLDELEGRAEAELTDKEQTILIYCRSGARAGEAARILQDLGYTHVYNFGGIISWPYEVEK